MKFNFLLLSIVSLISIQCTSDNRIFKANTISGDNIKMMIIPADGKTLHNDLNSDLKNGIEITDITIIQKIYDTQPISHLSRMFMPNSTGFISINGEIHSNFFLNKEFTNIHTSLGNFEISKNVFLNNQSSFNKLNKIVISSEEKVSAIKMREALIQNGIFILYRGTDPIPSWVNFDGKIILGYKGDITSLPNFESQLKQDLSNSLSDFKLGEIEFLDEIKSIEIFCNEFNNKIPSNYSVISEYEPLKDIQMTIIGTERSEIEKLISDSKIDKVTIN